MEAMTLNMPVVALRGMTVFPELTASFDVEREISIYALDNAMDNDRRVMLVTQRDISTQLPQEKDIYTIGTVCRILQIIKTSDSSVRLIVEGLQRARIHRLWQNQPFLQANVELLEEQAAVRHTDRVEALLRQTYAIFSTYREMVPTLGDDVVSRILDSRDPGRLADYIAQNLTLRHTDRQRVLEQLHPVRRLMLVNEILAHEVDVIALEVQLEQRVRERVARLQKNTILREQVKVLQQELGEDDDEELEGRWKPRRRPRCPRRSARSWKRSWTGWASRPSAALRPRSSATIWTCVWRCPGVSRRRIGPM